MSQEALHFILEQKIAYLNMTGNVCMLWWVTSVVFCATLLASAWSRRKVISSTKSTFAVAAVAGLIFFASVIGYGLLALDYLQSVKLEISEVAELAGVAPDFLDSEISIFRWAMINGTSSFVIVLLLWLYMLWVMARARWFRGGSAKSKQH